MSIKLDYATRETASNLRRNLLLTTASMLTVAVSLSMVGVALLLRYGVDNATQRWKNGVEFEIFLNLDVSPEQQADYLVRYFLQALGPGAVERVFWWQMIAKGYGLVDPVGPGELRRRPAFDAFRTMIRELEGSRLEAVLPVAAPARLWLFQSAQGDRLAVGWSTAGPVRVVLPDGTEVEVTASPRYFPFRQV